MSDEDYTQSESPSTIAVMSAAKASPLLNLTSEVVNKLSNSEVAAICDSDPGLIFIQRMTQSTVISSIDRTVTSSVKAELQQLAQEVRKSRRALLVAEGIVEDLVLSYSDAGDSGPSASLQRQHARATTALDNLRTDMNSVLRTLYGKCTLHGLDICDFISQEDANLLSLPTHV
jgi:hypothetical protein